MNHSHNNKNKQKANTDEHYVKNSIEEHIHVLYFEEFFITGKKCDSFYFKMLNFF